MTTQLWEAQRLEKKKRGKRNQKGKDLKITMIKIKEIKRIKNKTTTSMPSWAFDPRIHGATRIFARKWTLSISN